MTNRRSLDANNKIMTGGRICSEVDNDGDTLVDRRLLTAARRPLDYSVQCAAE